MRLRVHVETSKTARTLDTADSNVRDAARLLLPTSSLGYLTMAAWPRVVSVRTSSGGLTNGCCFCDDHATRKPVLTYHTHSCFTTLSTTRDVGFSDASLFTTSSSAHVFPMCPCVVWVVVSRWLSVTVVLVVAWCCVSSSTFFGCFRRLKSLVSVSFLLALSRLPLHL